MRSIRQRLFLQMAIVLLTTLSLIWLANITFLEDYYISQQKQRLLENYATLNTIDALDLNNNFHSFIKIESKSNVVIIITEPDGTPVYTSRGYINNADFITQSMSDDSQGETIPLPLHRPTDNDPTTTTKKPSIKDRPIDVRPKLPNEEVINDAISFSTGFDTITGGQSVALVGQLSNGYNINLRTPIASVQNSINVTNKFLVIIGAGIMVLAMGITFIFSNYFTKPIKEISRVTGHMKALDFSAECQVTSHDELGALAVNVNEMSKVLSSTISELNGSNQQLTEEINAKILLDQKRRQLLNNVSHELKTPLALMEGYAEALQLGIHTNPEKIDFYCNVIMDETDKMNQLVQNLLDIDQMEFGDNKSKPVTLNLSDYLTHTLHKYEPQFGQSGVSLTTDIPSNIKAFVDPLRLEQVFVNYLTNAIHYTTGAKEVSVHLTTSTSKAIIEVHNTTAFLSEEQMDKIWDSFYKTDKARSREVGGHGLGLSIVKAIQSSDGLGYGVTNEGDGVTFWFDLVLG